MVYSLQPFSHSAPLLVTGYALFTNRRSRWRDAMATRYSIILSTLCLLCTACTLQQDMVAVREDLANLRQDVATLTAHVQRQDAATGQLQEQVTQGQQSLEHLVPLTARLARLEAIQTGAVAARNGKA